MTDCHYGKSRAPVAVMRGQSRAAFPCGTAMRGKYQDFRPRVIPQLGDVG